MPIISKRGIFKSHKTILTIPCKHSRIKYIQWLCLLLSSIIIMAQPLTAEQLNDFSSDGCSQFPDGTFEQQDLWCSCCITHDIAYWQGGTSKQKKQADEALRQCVLQKTDNKLLADTMYYGVTLGGSPIFPVWYRWGYGWHYGRGFQALNENEQQQVEKKLQYYYLSLSQPSCDFEHPIQTLIKQQTQKFLHQ